MPSKTWLIIGKIPSPNVPNITHNSLPNHGGRINALLIEKDGPNLVHLIKPIENKEGKAAEVNYLKRRLHQSSEVDGKREGDLEIYWKKLQTKSFGCWRSMYIVLALASGCKR